MSYVEGDFLSQTTAYKLFMRGSDDAWHALGVSRIVADGVAEGDFTVEGTLDVSGGLVYVGSSSSYLQESSGDLYLGSGGGATLRLDGTANLAHFYGAVTMASTLGVTGAVDIGSYSLSEDKHVTIKTNSEYDVSYRLFESLENDGTSFAFDGGTNKGSIRRHSNSASGTAVIEWDRDSDGVDITGTLGVSGYISAGSDPAAPTGNDQAHFGAAASYGAVVIGQGTVYDVTLQQETGALALAIPTGTNNIKIFGDANIDGGVLTVQDSGFAPYLKLICPNTGQSWIHMGGTSDTDAGRIGYSDNSDLMLWYTDNTKGVTLDSVQTLQVWANGGSHTLPTLTTGTDALVLSGSGTNIAAQIVTGTTGLGGWYVADSGGRSRGGISYDNSIDTTLIVGGGANLYGFTSTSISPLNGNVKDLGVNTSVDFRDAYVRNGVTTGSDVAFKKNIESIDLETAYKIMSKARAVGYQQISNSGKEISYGYIAHELLKLFKSNGVDPKTCGVFKYDPTENVWGIRYHQLTPWENAANQWRDTLLEKLVH